MKTEAWRFVRSNWTEWVSILAGLAKHWKDTSGDLAKIEAAIYYIKAVNATRLLLIAVFVLFLLLQLLIMGLIILHVAIFFAPWSTITKAWVLFSLGLGEFLIALTAVTFFFSQPVWMKFSKSQEITEKLT